MTTFLQRGEDNHMKLALTDELLLNCHVKNSDFVSCILYHGTLSMGHFLNQYKARHTPKEQC